MNSKLKLISIGSLLFAVVGWSTLAAGDARQPDATNTITVATGKTLYTCGMHPWIVQDHPGNCPICGMKLEPVHQTTGVSSTGKVLYYKSTMKPTETSPGPAKDSMGMDMVPVYGTEGNASSTIVIDPATIQQMNIQTAEVTRGPLRRTIRTVGTIDYNETALVDVATRFKGWIEKLDVDATGQLVHRGQPLFEIYSPDLYSAEAEYLSVQGTNTDSSATALREAALAKLKFYEVADDQIAALKKSREPGRTLAILSPADGFVIEKNVVRGQMVDAGTKLYRLADLGIVWIFAQVYEQDLPYVQLGQEATVKLASLPDREFRGRVTYVYPDVDEKTRTAKVRLEFENPGYFLKPGMFVSAQITSELEPSALLVPDSAVLRSGAQNTVFVALTGGKYDARTVALGPEGEHGTVEVIHGLQAGERVVTSGQFMLDSESQLREVIQKMNGTAITMEPAAVQGTNLSEPGSAANVEKESEVYVCPMPEHVSIIYDHPGKCPICGMALVPVTPTELKQLLPGGKVLYYTCPMPEHSYVHADQPGKCPVCGMTLIPVMASPGGPTNTVSSSAAAPLKTTPVTKPLYTCPMHPEVISDQPGQCPKCGMNLVPVNNRPK